MSYGKKIKVLCGPHMSYTTLPLNSIILSLTSEPHSSTWSSSTELAHMKMKEPDGARLTSETACARPPCSLVGEYFYRRCPRFCFERVGILDWCWEKKLSSISFMWNSKDKFLLYQRKKFIMSHMSSLCLWYMRPIIVINIDTWVRNFNKLINDGK